MKTRLRVLMGWRHCGHECTCAAHCMHMQMCAQPMKHSGRASWHTTHSGMSTAEADAGADAGGAAAGRRQQGQGQGNGRRIAHGHERRQRRRQRQARPTSSSWQRRTARRLRFPPRSAADQRAKHPRSPLVRWTHACCLCRHAETARSDRRGRSARQERAAPHFSLSAMRRPTAIRHKQ